MTENKGALYVDFDQTLDAEEPIDFKLNGIYYRMPGFVPMGKVLRINRDIEREEAARQKALKNGEELPESDDPFIDNANMRAIREVMGPEQFDKLIENSSLTQFQKVIEHIKDRLFGKEEEAPKAEEVEETPSPSSTSYLTGLPSAQTSAGITHSAPAASSA